jgi:spore germination cell wall hydrolase CwlJ-like protein
MLSIPHKIFSLLILILGLLFVTPTKPISTESHFATTNFTKVDKKQLACMAENIFYEAGSESIKGQAAVARVVMNRVNHGFASNPCNVIYQKITVNDRVICQFSWVCEGKGQPNKNSYRYKVAEQIAYEVMVMNYHKDVVPKSALFFHSINIDPLWPYKKVATIGGHVFYAKTKINQQPKKIEPK